VLVQAAGGNEGHGPATAVAAGSVGAVLGVVQLGWEACTVGVEMQRMGLAGLAVVEEAVVHRHHTAVSECAGLVRTRHAPEQKLALVLRLE
jgi:hypothetical protein